MSQSIDLPFNTQCYLCDSFYAQAQEQYFVYKCFCCMEFTPYCFSCELKLQKLFGCGNFFKCAHCNKLTNALDKMKINPLNLQMNLNPISQSLPINNPYFKTPIKSFFDNNIPISSIKLNNNDIEERKDNLSNSCSNNRMISNFINEFKLINLALNPNKNDNISQIRQIQNCPENNTNFMHNSISINRDNNHEISNIPKRTLTNSNSVNNFSKINDYSLLKTKARISRRFRINDTFLGRKRDDSNLSHDEYKGYNKSKDKVTSKNKYMFGTTKPKKIITKKMSKIYKSDININSLKNRDMDFNRTANNFLNYNGNFGISSMNNDSKINSSLFMNQNSMFGQGGPNTISGTTTPHKFYVNGQNQYF